jgi:hypothetical protein
VDCIKYLQLKLHLPIHDISIYHSTTCFVMERTYNRSVWPQKSQKVWHFTNDCEKIKEKHVSKEQHHKVFQSYFFHLRHTTKWLHRAMTAAVCWFWSNTPLDWMLSHKAAFRSWMAQQNTYLCKHQMSGHRIPVKVKISAPVLTGLGAQPASCILGTGSRSRG